MKKRIKNLITELSKDLVEREETVRLSILATLAGENIFLLGPPGVAKSLIARRLKDVFKDGTEFEYLMNRFSTPEEIFGPISIQKLKEDKYERKTEKYLPDADIVFLDEIWKASPSIQNSLLTTINEKIYKNGTTTEKVKLKVLISASNELPAKNEGLEALWDRFIIRQYINNIKDEDNFNMYLMGSNFINGVKITEKISKTELEEWQKEIEKIIIPDEIFGVISIIRKEISLYNKKNPETPIYVSDRRWKKIIKILKTSAFINERKRIDLMDTILINYMIWDEIEHIDIVRNIISTAIKNHGYSKTFNLKMFNKKIEELAQDLKKETARNKIPHKLIITGWNEQIKKYKENIVKTQKEIEKYINNLNIQDNVFVDSKYSDLALNNIKDTEAELGVLISKINAMEIRIKSLKTRLSAA